MSYADNGPETRPIISGLGRLYEQIGALHWPLIRGAVGIILFTHGWPKLMAGAQIFATNSLAKRGIEPALPFAYAVIFLETAGALLITIGLFTRPIAIAIVAEFIVIISTSLSNGWAWTKGGIEFPLLWGLIFLAIAIRGGGPYSVDRAIGREV